MPDERARHAVDLPPSHDDGITPPSSYEQFITWAAGLPWWAIILGVFVVVVAYSMLSSAAYRRVIRQLTDDPQVSTTDKFNVVQIVGEPTVVTGMLASETTDTIPYVLEDLLETSVGAEEVTYPGFVETAPVDVITVRTDDGIVHVPKDQIIEETRTETDAGTQITLAYTNRVTVSGVMTAENDSTMTIRTVDEEKETFAVSRVLSREVTAQPCPEDAAPDCEPREVVTIQREGEILAGTLKTLSNTNLSLDVDGDGSREIRRNQVEYFYVPTLTIAMNEESAQQPVESGAEFRIGFVQGTDISEAIDELGALDAVGVPLAYNEGEVSVVLVPYPDLDTALQATSEGDINSLIYLDDGPERMAVATWASENPDAGVVVSPPRECNKGCPVTLKLIDDEVTGRIDSETAGEITIVTTEAEFEVIDKELIVENRRKEPGVCALNNIWGCNAGIFLTITVTIRAYLLALLIGLIFGLLRVQTNPVLYAGSTLYVEVMRGIPLLVILLYAGFVVSPWIRDNLGIQLSDEWEAVLGLAIGYGAFIAEIFRAGIQSIGRGQMEAARSLGMSYPQAMFNVVLPQAVRVVLPPLGNDFIAMLKDSALISVLALPDLLQLGRLFVSRTFRAFEGYNTVAVLYLVMTIFLSMLVRIIERRSRLPG